MEYEIVGEDNLTRIVGILLSNTLDSEILKLDQNWSEFAIRLGVGGFDTWAQNYQIGITNFSKLLYNVLLKWATEKTETPTVQVLYDELRNCRLNSVADNLKREILKELRERFFLQGKVDFQGRETTLKQLVQQTSSNSFTPYITDKILAVSGSGQTVKILKELSSPAPYYIQRTLKLGNKLQQEIFQVKTQDVFVFIGLEPYKLAKLAMDSGSLSDIWSSQTSIDVDLVRFVLLEYKPDFEQICKHSNHPVHLIEHKNGEYYWLKSHGEVSLVQKYIHQDQEIISEVDFVRKNLKEVQNTPVCIGDTPGMGKTMLLQHIAHLVRMEYSSSRIILFFVLQEILQELNDSNMDALQFLLKKSAGDLGVEVLHHISFHFELFFDGFDEVHPSQKQVAKDLFKSLMTLKNVRVHVTTRPHMKTELERTLGSIGYTIIPFSEQNQRDFLKLYWINKFQVEEKDTPKLEKFAEECLKKIQTEMTDLERDITGIPLQCFMLAEVYAGDAEKYSKGNIKFSFSVNVNSISDMYQKLFKQKFDKLGETASSDFKKKIMNEHVFTAVKLLFPDWTQELTCLSSESQMVQLSDEVFKVGIIEKNSGDGTSRFIHRTFAECLLAGHIVQDFFRECPECTPLLINVVLGECRKFEENIFRKLSKLKCSVFRFQYPTLAYFVDAYLKEKKFERQSLKLVAPDVDRTLSACCTSSLISCFQLMTEIFKEEVKLAPEEWADMILVASKYSSSGKPEIVRKLVKFMEEKIDKKLYELEFPSDPRHNFAVSALHVAVQNGSLTLTSDLINLLTPGKVKDLQFLFHFCTFESIFDEQIMINRKEQIIKLIDSVTKHCLEERWPGDMSTPINAGYVHFKLIKCLTELGADVNAMDEGNDTILHNISYEKGGQALITSSEYTQVMNLLTFHNFYRWDEKSKKEFTPLALAARNLELEEEALQHFVAVKANFNSCDEDGISVLIGAVMNSRSVHLIQRLIKLGCDSKHRDIKGMSLLHVASSLGNIDLVKYLVDSKISNVNEVTIHETTALHYALCGRSEGHYLVQGFLIDNGANLEAEDSDGDIPLIDALKGWHGVSLNIIDKMEKKGLNMAKYASSALISMVENTKILAPTPEFSMLFKYFLENGGKLPCESASAKNIFELIKEKKEALIQMIILSEEFLEKVNLPIRKYSEGVRYTPKDLYSDVCNLQVQLEGVMLALLETKQFKAFQALRNLFQFERQFNAPPDGVLEFLSSSERILVIHSNIPETCTNRIIDTVENVVEYDDVIGKQSEFEEDVTYVYMLRDTEINLENLVQFENAPCGRFIFVGDVIGEDVYSNYNVLRDIVQWSDLSQEYMNDLLYNEWQGFRLCRQSKLKLLEVKECLLAALDSEVVTLECQRQFGKQMEVAVANFSEEMKNQMEKAAMAVMIGNSNFSEAPDPPVTSEGWYLAAKSILQKEKFNGDQQYVSTENAMLTVDSLKDMKFEIETYGFKYDLLVYFLDWMIGNGAEMTLDFGGDYIPKFLAACVYSRAKNLIHLMVQKGQLKNIKRASVGTPNVNILHLLVLDTVNLAEDEIEDRKKILSTLIGTGYSNLNEFITEYNLTPLLLPDLHVELIKHLVTLGANVTSATTLGTTFAHHAAFLPLEQFQELVRYLVRKGLAKTVFDARCNKQCTPLHTAVSQLEVDSTSLDMLLAADVNINDIDEDGDNVLFHAIIHESTVRLLKTLVDKGADWEGTNKKGSSALHVACDYNNLEAIKFLIGVGCDANQEDGIGLRPFDYLLRRGYGSTNEIVQLLLPITANVVHFLVLHTVTFSQEEIHDRMKLIEAAVNQNVTLLNEGIGKDNEPPIVMWSVHVKLLKYLIELGADIRRTDLSSGKTFAHLAARYLPPEQFQELVGYLKEKGILKEVFSAQDNTKCTPLHDAMIGLEMDSNTLDVILSAGVNLHGVDGDGNNLILHAVIWGRSVELLNLLVERGANWSIRDNNGSNALHLAAKQDNLDALKYFLELRSDINARDNLLSTPLDILLEKGYGREHEGVQLILKDNRARGTVHSLVQNTMELTECAIADRKKLVEMVSQTTKKSLLNERLQELDGCTPLLMSNVHVELLKQLIDLGSDLSVTTVQYKSTFVHLASSYLPLDQFKELVLYLSIIKRNKFKNIFNSRDGNSQTPLHVLSKRQDVDPSTIELLASNDVDVDPEDNRGYTPFLLAVSHSVNLNVLKALVQYGAKWSHKTIGESSALHLAVESQPVNLELLQYLAELGCDVNLKNLEGLTPLDILKRNEDSNANQALQFFSDSAAKKPRSMIAKLFSFLT